MGASGVGVNAEEETDPEYPAPGLAQSGCACAHFPALPYLPLQESDLICYQWKQKLEQPC